MERIVRINGRAYTFMPHGTGNPTMYIWASKHAGPQGIYGMDDLQDQESFLRTLRTDAVLHEFFLNIVYDPTTQKFTYRGTDKEATKFRRDLETDEYKYLTEIIKMRLLAHDLGFKIIGCDTKAVEGAFDESLDSKREQEQANVIEEYNGCIERPRLSIIGDEHCQPDSYLNEYLQEKNIDYTVIRRLEEISQRDLVFA